MNAVRRSRGFHTHRSAGGARYRRHRHGGADDRADQLREPPFYMRDKTLAEWVALNQIETVRLALQRTGERRNGRRRRRWPAANGSGTRK